MKPFNLKEALAGEPVKLRDGTKAIIIGKFLPEHCYTETRPVVGYVLNVEGKIAYSLNWFFNGSYKNEGEYKFDIVGMWEEPRPTVTLTLPCPLKEPKEGMWIIGDNFKIYKSKFTEDNPDIISKEDLMQGRYFDSEKDAQVWLDALKNSRR